MVSTRWLPLGAIVVALSLLASPVRAADEPAKQAAQQWEDFCHYVAVARPDLAAVYGQALLTTTEQQLLDIAEAASRLYDPDDTLRRAMKMTQPKEQVPQLKDVAAELAKKINSARMSRSRDAKRIDEDIEKLAQGERAYGNAIERLRAAGQFAAPQLLLVLLDDNRANMHTYVRQAMIAIGQPMVPPLSVALPDLDPRTMSQVASILATIGYPDALPYIKQAIEDPKTDKDVLPILKQAFDRIAAVSPRNTKGSAAQLYLDYGQHLYNVATYKPTEIIGYDKQSKRGIVWYYNPMTRLTKRDVPGEIFGDVIALRAATRAIALDPQLDPALSLWLAANLRRENRLPAGQQDPSYPVEWQTPSFYAQMAGPARLHDVLAWALRDGDAALALDAIQALSATAGTNALVNRRGNTQPLLDALYYPDRRVRFAAAFAMTNARPKSEFPGSFRVVPVLADATRQTTTKYALVVATDPDTLNRLTATLSGKDFGYVVTRTGSSSELTPVAGHVSVVDSAPGFDVIVVAASPSDVRLAADRAADNPKLASVPVVAVVNEADKIELDRYYDIRTRRPTIALADSDSALKAALDDASKAYVGEPITTEQADQYALTALSLLRELASGYSAVYHVEDAVPALIQALKDTRPQVAKSAASTLSLIDNMLGQRALADNAIDSTRAPDVRIAMLNSLAESATYYGNLLDAPRIENILALTKTSQGDLALAASKAVGALSLPTSNVVDLISTKK